MKLSRSNSWRYLAKPYKKSTTLYREALSFTFLSVDIGPANTDTGNNNFPKNSKTSPGALI
jgi:hypothetical protein